MSDFFSASEIIQFTIRIGENGEEFYRLMAEKVDDDFVKDVFNFLANGEVEHRKIFEGILSEIKEYKPTESYSGEYFAYLKAYADGHIFTSQNQGKLKASKIDSVNEALDFAIRIEIDSILYYLEAKNFVPQAQKSIIDKIIEEERRHYLKLLEVKK